MNCKAPLCLVLATVLLLAACAPAPPAATPVLPTATTTATVPPTATNTPTNEPATPTATEAAPTVTPTHRPSATPRATATPSATSAPATATTAATAAATATTVPAGSGDFTPAQAQVWNTALVGGDTMTGGCSAPANAPYGLVALTPGQGSLALRNTVPEDYVLARLGPNTYQFAGPAALGDGTLTLDVVFTSATTLEMTRTFAPSAEPGCTHQHRYTGAFRNNR